jgi:hypothetical protein
MLRVFLHCRLLRVIRNLVHSYRARRSRRRQIDTTSPPHPIKHCIEHSGKPRRRKPVAAQRETRAFLPIVCADIRRSP